MAFQSMTFIVFFAVVLLLYYLMPKKIQWLFLLASSYFFYLYASPKFLFYILFTTVSAWAGAVIMGQKWTEEKIKLAENGVDKKEIREKGKTQRKRVLIAVLVANFGILFFLKYFNFISDNLNLLLGANGKLPRLNLILPLGISFYTFQSMGYVVDVYWGKVQAEKNIAKVALFISYFPQIVEGPISRWKDLTDQLWTQRRAEWPCIKAGLELMLWGLFKKLVIADRFAVVANYVFGNYEELSGFQILFGAFFYAIQDYTDFSGCIDIARGASEAMGIRLEENFQRPYFSRTIPEYWRRWHITLGSWFKDYIYYPISISTAMKKLSKKARDRFGKHIGRSLPALLGLSLVWLITGIWHGSSWNYILWGCYYGFLIICGILFEPIIKGVNKKLKLNHSNPAVICLQVMRTFFLTMIGRVIFRAEGVAAAGKMLKKFFHGWELYGGMNIRGNIAMLGLNKANYVLAAALLILLFIVDYMQEKAVIPAKMEKMPGVLQWGICLAGFAAILVFGVYGPDIEMSAFVYTQF